MSRSSVAFLNNFTVFIVVPLLGYYDQNSAKYSPSIRKKDSVVASPSSPAVGMDAARRKMSNSLQNSWERGRR